MIKLITGFIPIPNHPRSTAEYVKLGRNFLDVKNDVAVYNQHLGHCWMSKYLSWRGTKVEHSEGDNPKKNSLAYHAVQHQKVEFMLDAAYRDPAPEVFAWIDYGIFHIPGVTAAVIDAFAERAANEKAIAIPGCWPKPDVVTDDAPCWRFCGGLLVCPRKYLFELDAAIKADVMDQVNRRNHVSWDVNTLARVEQNTKLPFWWYPADHNATMFTNYQENGHAS